MFFREQSRYQLCSNLVHAENGVPTKELHFETTNVRFDPIRLIPPFKKTLFPFFQVKREFLIKHFASFGPIEWSEIYTERNRCHGNIRYKTVHSAKLVRNVVDHYIGISRVIISSKDDATSIRRPIKNTTNMLDMNDDCLYEILNHLNCMELCVVDQTCIRLRKIARNLFRVKHSAIDLTQQPNASKLSLAYVKHLFVHFGSEIQKLKINANSFHSSERSAILELLFRNCTALRHLCLTGFCVYKKYYEINEALFAEMEELSFDLCKLNENIRNMFIKCKQLRKLTIRAVTNLNGSCLSVRFPRLTSISLVLNAHLRPEHLCLFINANKQLKSIELLQNNLLSDSILTSISRKLRQLECLHVDFNQFINFEKNLNLLSSLKNLCDLQMDCNDSDVSSFIERLATKDKIEILHLSNVVVDEHLIDALAKCKRLKTLKFCCTEISERYLMELAKRLIELNDFHVSKCHSVDSHAFIHFVDLARRLQTLHISNSDIRIDDEFVQRLVQIYTARKSKLVINLYGINYKITPALLMANEKVLQINDPFRFSGYDINYIDLETGEFFFSFFKF